jgi:hypothetical protein
MDIFLHLLSFLEQEKLFIAEPAGVSFLSHRVLLTWAVVENDYILNSSGF